MITIVPANEASWDDLDAIFGTRGDPSRCYCQRYKMAPGEAWANFPAEERAFRLRRQTDCGHPDSDTTSGLVAYLDGEPSAGARSSRAPPTRACCSRRACRGTDATEDKTDDSVWAVTCFVTRKGFRRRGISRALARAAVDFARERGARALEGYPMVTEPDLIGRAPRRQPQHLRRRGIRRGRPPDPPPGRDAHRANVWSMIEPGEKAPDFTLPDQDGNDVSLSDYAGQTVVLYFYPKADTPGCTTQACGIRDRAADYDAAGAVVIGVSPDPVDLVKKFHGGQSLNFTLLADEDHAVCDLYGIWVEKSMYGKTYWGAQRSTFIIDGDGTVVHVIEKASPKTHDDEVLGVLAAA